MLVKTDTAAAMIAAASTGSRSKNASHSKRNIQYTLPFAEVLCSMAYLTKVSNVWWMRSPDKATSVALSV
jgi:hypothetical protein